jgi:hypothetical protein
MHSARAYGIDQDEAGVGVGVDGTGLFDWTESNA